MWKGKKKFIVVGLLGVVVVAGSIAGIAYAQTGTTATSSNTTLLDRVATILKIDPQTLKSAFTQAQKEQRDQALTDRLNNLVKQGKLTQKQADDYKTWLNQRPDVPLPGGNQSFGKHFQGRGMMRPMAPNFRGAPAPTNPVPTQPQ